MMTLPTHTFPAFVISFMAGLIFLLGWLIFLFSRWIGQTESDDLKTIRGNIFSVKTLQAIREVFMESLLHRKLFRKNPFLGYMHMCFALGWFLLIVIGKLEVISYSGKITARPYVAIFFKYFVTPEDKFPYSGLYSFVMDLILLFILSGLALALLKRFKSNALGMVNTTKHNSIDKWTLAVLWFIFPARLVAESLASGSQGYSFLTGTLGRQLATFLPVEQLQMPAWWFYSFTLCGFFVLLPFSRYMHIPTEVGYIFLKYWGLTKRDVNKGFTNFEIYSCSRCGVCIDACQLKTQAGINGVQSVNFTRDIRHNTLNEDNLKNCLMCNRCTEACPVGIELTLQRQSYRGIYNRFSEQNFDYLETNKTVNSSEVIYFPGCMSSLTPGIEKAMVQIMQQAGENYLILNEEQGACCGRPMLLSGNPEAADKLISYNRDFITESGAKKLVTSCPICYKMFRDYYQLHIPVLHHSEYLLNLSEQGKIHLEKEKHRVVYHDPCELGRGSKIYEQPRELLNLTGKVEPMAFEKENALCCGSSLGNTKIDQSSKDKIVKHLVDEMTACNPDMLATACPVCKRAISSKSPVNVMDIAEIVAGNLKKQAVSNLQNFQLVEK